MGRDEVRPMDATAQAKSYEDRLQRGKREAAERERERLADVDERFADFWKALGFAGGGSDGKTLAGVQLAGRFVERLRGGLAVRRFGLHPVRLRHGRGDPGEALAIPIIHVTARQGRLFQSSPGRETGRNAEP